jgi:hypothetical protein
MLEGEIMLPYPPPAVKREALREAELGRTGAELDSPTLGPPPRGPDWLRTGKAEAALCHFVVPRLR